jgi:hypothetical protein
MPTIGVSRNPVIYLGLILLATVVVYFPPVQGTPLSDEEAYLTKPGLQHSVMVESVAWITEQKKISRLVTDGNAVHFLAAGRAFRRGDRAFSPRRRH